MYRITYFTFIILIGYCNSIDAQGRLIKEFNYSFSCLTDIHVDGLNMYAALEDNKIQLFENGIWTDELQLLEGKSKVGSITKDVLDTIWMANDNGLFSYFDGVVIHYTTTNSSLPTNNLRAVHAFEEQLWLVENGTNIFKKNGSNYEPIQPFGTNLDSINNSEILPNGDFVAVSLNKIAVVNNADEIEIFSFERTINDLFLDFDGNLIIATENEVNKYITTDRVVENLNSIYESNNYVTIGINPSGELYGALPNMDLIYNDTAWVYYEFNQFIILEKEFEKFFIYDGILRYYGTNTSSFRCSSISTPKALFDWDNDSFYDDEDCDDHNRNVYPGAAEILNNAIDEDCDGEVDQLDLKKLNFPNNDMVYIPSKNKIYSLTSESNETPNSLCIIDPIFGVVDTCFTIGDEPTVISNSNDDQFLYIGFENSPEIKRYNLALDSVDLVFNLGTDSESDAPLYAEDIKVFPNNAEIIAVARKNPLQDPSHNEIGIFNNGVLQPLESIQGKANAILFTDENTLYGIDNETSAFKFFEYEITNYGIEKVSEQENLFEELGVNMEFKSNRIYSSYGQVLEISPSLRLIDSSFFFNNSLSSAIEIDKNTNLVYFARQELSSNPVLEIYNYQSFERIKKYQMPELNAAIIKLISIGDGLNLAFNTNEEIIFLRTCSSIILDSLSLSSDQIGGCIGDTVRLNVEGNFENYVWSTGEQADFISVTQNGNFSYAPIDSLGCSGPQSNVINLQFDQPPTRPSIESEDSITLCRDETIELNVFFSSGDDFIWSTGDTGRVLNVSSEGIFQVARFTENGCVGPFSDSVIVDTVNAFRPAQPEIILNGTIEFCSGDTTFLTSNAPQFNHLWSNRDSSLETFATSTSLFELRVYDDPRCISDASERIIFNVTNTPNQPEISRRDSVLVSSAFIRNQWFFNGVEIPGATNSRYQPTEDGDYTVQVTFQGCPSPMSDPFNFIRVSNYDLNLGNDLFIFPNPAKDALHIQYKNNVESKIAFIHIYNNVGKLIGYYRQENTVNLTHLSNGIYIIKALDADHHILLNNKFIKQ